MIAFNFTDKLFYVCITSRSFFLVDNLRLFLHSSILDNPLMSHPCLAENFVIKKIPKLFLIFVCQLCCWRFESVGGIKRLGKYLQGLIVSLVSSVRPFACHHNSGNSRKWRNINSSSWWRHSDQSPHQKWLKKFIFIVLAFYDILMISFRVIKAFNYCRENCVERWDEFARIESISIA